MDVVGCDDTMLSDMADREERLRIREPGGPLPYRPGGGGDPPPVRTYPGRLPQTQRQVAAAFGISRS